MEIWHMGIGAVFAVLAGLAAVRALSSGSSSVSLEPLDESQIKFIPAKFFRVGPPGGRRIRWLVVHTAETGESPTSAEGVAWYFHDPKDKNGKPVEASAHYSGDNNSIVQSVKDRDIAHAAPPMNDEGLHFELAGRASQAAIDWDDDYSRAELELAARWFASKAAKYAVPLRWVDAAGLKRGESGLTTHVEISKAFGKTTHQDPGPNFPAAKFLELVKSVKAAA